MISQKNNKRKVFAYLKIDHIIDLITNSSSELFVIENKCAKETICEIINEALKGATSVTVDCIEERFTKDGDLYSQEYEIENALKMFPENAIEELKEKYFKNPKYYGVSFDRDWIYQMDNDLNFDVRSKLINIGFELVDTDY